MSIGNIKHHTAPLDASDSSTFNAAESSTISGPDSLSIELQITNPEVQIELLSRQEVPARQKYATDALTVGAMYFRQVQSRIDEQSIESIGKKLIDRANEVVTARGIEIINQLDGLCKQYLSDDGKLASEFSTDAPDSALSRMLARVEHAHKRIADEFSSDNEQSALNRLTNILQSTNSYIQKQPTLDNQDSALNLAL